MAKILVDTYSFIERLVQAGMPEPQARAVADGLREIDLDNVATKEDVATLRCEIAEVKVDLLKWLVPLFLGQAGLITALVKLL
jgi:hypothetical protein